MFIFIENQHSVMLIFLFVRYPFLLSIKLLTLLLNAFIANGYDNGKEEMIIKYRK